MHENNYTSDAFSQIEKSAEEAFGNIEKRSAKSQKTICEDAKKAADYQAQYDALMNEKRYRTLSTYENKRARILKSNIDYYKNLRDGEFEDIKYKLEMGEISNKEYYQKLAALRDSYFKKGSEEWNKYTVDIIKYNKEVVSNQQKELEEMLLGIDEKYEESFSQIFKKQASMQQKLDKSLGIYETVHFEMADGVESDWLRLANVDVDLEILKNYNNALISVKGRLDSIFSGMGLSEEKSNEMKAKFFEEIASLSIGKGTAFANHINFKSDEELVPFLEKWVEKVDLSEAISKNLYADEASYVMQNYANDMSSAFRDSLSENFGRIPDTFFANGIESALEFKNGFLSVIDEALNDINLELSNKMSAFMPDVSVLSQGNSVTNNSSYNIYGADSPAQTALEIYKQNEKNRMLVGG